MGCKQQGGRQREMDVCECVCLIACACVHRAIDVQREAERSRCKEERLKDRWAGGRNMRGIGKLDPGMKKNAEQGSKHRGPSHLI